MKQIRVPLIGALSTGAMLGVAFMLGLGFRSETPHPMPTPRPTSEAAAPVHAQMPGTAAGPGVESNIFVNLAKRAVPSVVNISTYTNKQQPYGAMNQDEMFRRFFDEFFRRYGGPRGGDEGGGDEGDGSEGGGGDDRGPPGGGNGKGSRALSLGTGFIIDSAGLILTNNHVVADADEIKINFTEALDEKPTDGEVIGRDPELDIALIRVKTSRKLEALPLGDSEAMQVGEYVMAVGNPFGQGHSVTHGIVSAKGRLSPDFPLASYLQTDAPINPGNSGGPLLNLRGEVIAINNAIDARAVGIGFAIPIDVVKKILPQLKSKGTVTRGFIGVLVNELNPDVAEKLGVSKDLRAPFATHVYPGEPAEKAGLKPYDVILKFADRDIHSSAELIAAVTTVNVGESTQIKILRNGKEQDLKIKVGPRPGTDKDSKSAKGGDKKKPHKKPPVETGMQLDELNADDNRDLGLPANTQGVIVDSVSYGSPADRAGIMRGDVIVEVDRKPIRDVDGFFAIVKEKKSYLLRLRRLDRQGKESFSVGILDLD